MNSLTELFFTILSVSGYLDFQDNVTITTSFNEVISWMKSHKILLVIDDLDSWDWGEILNFIGKVPPESAVVITSRRVVDSRYLPGVVPFDLDTLPFQQAYQLIDSCAQQHDLHFKSDHKSKIFEYSNGNPLIIQLMISLVAKRSQKIDLLHPLRWLGLIPKTAIDDDINEIIDTIRESPEAQEFLFKNLYSHLTEKQKYVLSTVAIAKTELSRRLTLRDLERITSISSDTLSKILIELSKSALIQIYPSRITRYDIHEYVLTM